MLFLCGQNGADRPARPVGPGKSRLGMAGGHPATGRPCICSEIPAWGRNDEYLNLCQSAVYGSHTVDTLRYSVLQSCRVALKIYDSLGRLVKTSVDEVKSSGAYEVVWEGKDSAVSTVVGAVREVGPPSRLSIMARSVPAVCAEFSFGQADRIDQVGELLIA